VTGDAARPGGEAQACCRGENNPAGKRSKLHLDSGSDVRKPGRVSSVNRTEIVGQIDEEFSAMGYPQPNSRIRAVDASRGAALGLIPFSACKLPVGTTKLELVTSGRSVWISLWVPGQYSAAKTAAISRPSPASRRAKINLDRTAFMTASLRHFPGQKTGRRPELPLRSGYCDWAAGHIGCHGRKR